MDLAIPVARHVLILHHDDLDGRLAGYIASRHLWDPYSFSLTIQEMNYDMPVPWGVINGVDCVCIVDFSLSPADFQKLLNLKKKVVWIDHHKTAIQEVEEAGLTSQLPGLRAEAYPSGAYLTWLFFNPGKVEVPEVVDIVSKYDTWKHNGDTKILSVKTALDLYNPFEYRKMYEILLTLPESAANQLLVLQEEGRAVRNAELHHGSELVLTNGFWVNFHHRNWWACNGNRLNSLVFEDALRKNPSKMAGAHGWMAFKFTGRKWEVSLYGNSLHPEYKDMGEICKQYGGGGHDRAAGFEPDNPPCAVPSEYMPPKRSR